MRTLRIYFLNNFPIYHTAVLTIVTMLYIYIPSTYFSYNWKFVPFDHIPPIPPSPALQIW